MSGVSISILGLIILIALAGVAWALLQDAFVRVQPGEVGVVLRRGRPAKRGLLPGVHFSLRFGREIVTYPSVEMTYLAVSEPELSRTVESDITFVDPPFRLALGDRSMASLEYTARLTIDTETIAVLHNRFGTKGLKGIARDETRRVLLDLLGNTKVSAATVIGDARQTIEEAASEALKASLAELGFTLAMFSLRVADLGERGEVIQDTLRAAEELERERARGEIRALRAKQEVAVQSALAGSLTPEAIEYLRIQATREFIERWDGKTWPVTTPGSPLAEVAQLAPQPPTPPAEEKPAPAEPAASPAAR